MNPQSNKSIKIIRNEDKAEVPVSHQKDLKKKVIIPNWEIDNLLQFAEAKFKKGDEILPHQHDSMCEIFYIITGSLLLTTPDTEYELKTNDAFYIQPKTQHSLKFKSDCSIIYFGIRTD